MNIIINKDVHEKFPEFSIFHKTIELNHQIISNNFNNIKFKKLKLKEYEINQYKEFRMSISEKDIFAVERLSKYSSQKDLPNPDPLTNLIIQASYYTKIPITIFSAEEFQNIKIRFSYSKDKLLTRNGLEPIPAGSLIAETEIGILGILGIKSSIIGKIKPKTKLFTVLSFGCNDKTNIKSQKLVNLITDEILMH